MQLSCANCGNARQAADKSRQDVVGCRLMTLENVPDPSFYGGNIYEGWLYGGRRPGNTGESTTVGEGMLTRGILVDATGYCKHHQPV